MPHEISAGIIIFYNGKEREYLLLHYPKGHWDFPKGHVEGREEPIATAQREIQEETGITNFTILQGFQEKISYFFRAEGKTIFKEVIFFLGESKTKEVTISHEHIGFVWLPYEKALQQITFQNSKNILKKAMEFLGN